MATKAEEGDIGCRRKRGTCCRVGRVSIRGARAPLLPLFDLHEFPGRLISTQLLPQLLSPPRQASMQSLRSSSRVSASNPRNALLGRAPVVSRRPAAQVSICSYSYPPRISITSRGPGCTPWHMPVTVRASSRCPAQSLVFARAIPPPAVHHVLARTSHAQPATTATLPVSRFRQ